MTNGEMEDLVKALVGDSRFDGLVPSYLTLAKGAVLGRLFPHDPDAEWKMVAERYHPQTCEIAVYLLSKRGAEGETRHEESGVKRSYSANGGIPPRFFVGMVPRVGVPR